MWYIRWHRIAQDVIITLAATNQLHSAENNRNQSQNDVGGNPMCVATTTIVRNPIAV